MLDKSGLVPGDKVVMHSCAESKMDKYKGKIFTVASNTWVIGSHSELVLLKEKPGGGFATMFLKKVGESK
jgi:hypothetical protein